MINENEKAIDKEKEQNYQRLVNLQKGIKCMPICKAKMEMYQNAAKQFSELSGYKDTDKNAEVCKRLAIQTNEKIKKTIYAQAQNKKKAAKIAVDYKSAAEEFRQVSGYLDAADMAFESERMSNRIEKKAIRKKLIKNMLILLCIIAVIAGSTTSHAKYYLANVYMTSGSNNAAINMYKKLGAYKDCVERLAECQYRNGLDLLKEEDLKSAVKSFAGAGNYKDSEVKKVEVEKLILKNSKFGNTVKIGDCKWIILDIKANQVLLMKKTAVPGMAYNDDFGDVTWNTSTLRQWLNSEFLDETFSQEERDNIILLNVKNSDNAVYNTDGGSDTQDYAYLLSIEEVEKYNAQFPTFKSNSWLRSPGNIQSSAAFLSVNGSAMDYGYVTTSREIKVRPVLWFNID